MLSLGNTYSEEELAEGGGESYHMPAAADADHPRFGLFDLQSPSIFPEFGALARLPSFNPKTHVRNLNVCVAKLLVILNF